MSNRRRSQQGAARPRPAAGAASGAASGAPKGRPASPGFRGKVERVSYPILSALHRQPRWLVVGGLVVLLVVGLLAPKPFAVPALAVAVAFLGWLTYLAWPEVQGNRRALRIVAFTLAVAAVILRATT
jgi:hypothetical protein